MLTEREKNPSDGFSMENSLISWNSRCIIGRMNINMNHDGKPNSSNENEGAHQQQQQ